MHISQESQLCSRYENMVTCLEVQTLIHTKPNKKNFFQQNTNLQVICSEDQDICQKLMCECDKGVAYALRQVFVFK